MQSRNKIENSAVVVSIKIAEIENMDDIVHVTGNSIRYLYLYCYYNHFAMLPKRLDYYWGGRFSNQEACFPEQLLFNFLPQVCFQQEERRALRNYFHELLCAAFSFSVHIGGKSFHTLLHNN